MSLMATMIAPLKRCSYCASVVVFETMYRIASKASASASSWSVSIMARAVASVCDAK